MRRTMMVAASLWLAGYVGGAATIYYGGPAIGAQLQHTGARLVGLNGDVGFTTAEEARQVVAALADDAVSERARHLLPASIVRR